MVTRKCGTCGKTFKRPEWFNRKAKRHFCSIKCLSLSQIKHIDIQKLSEFERGYLCGIIDGEGSIAGWKGKKWRISVDNTNWNLINWLGWRFGGSAYQGKSKLGKKICFKWQISLPGAKDILKLLMEKSIIKKDKAKEVYHALAIQ